MSEWKEYKLENLDIEIIDGDRGVNYPKQEEFFEKEYCLFLNTGNVTQEGFNFSSCSFITKQKDDILRKGKLKRKDVIITTRGTIGNAAYYSDSIPYNQIRINSGMIILRAKNEIITSIYLYHLLKSSISKSQFELFASGTAQPQLPIKDFKKIQYLIPSLSTQHRIASILSAYDDLIENNNRRIALLEQMAEQIYKEWFVRMRFPGYENTEFEKGVLKGWEVKSIKDFGKVVTGKTPSTSNSGYFGGKYPFIKTPDMHGNIFVLQTEETLSESGLISQKAQKLPANSICVSCIGTGGIVSITPSVCMTNQQINTMILENNSFLEFMFFSLKGLKPMIELFGATGATMTNLSKGKFENLKLIKPTEFLIEEFSKKTKPVFLQIRNLMEQQIKIKQTRDLLLPRLISGKLKVKDAEKEMEKM